ncbi:immunoglobulin superfamily member 1-like [Chrysemys picta bellii]|uniref:immunoglobulin superfamily member 1-like n=1 Tax=Chrysemys picta bellii TaxID=8478 RepID=UPI0032B13CCC
MWGSEVMGRGLGSCRRGCGLQGVAGSWLCSDHSRFGLEIAEKPSDGAERGRVHHRLPGAAAPSTVPHSARTRASGWVELGTGVLVAVLRGPHCPIMASALTVLLLGEYRRQPGRVPIRWDLRPGLVSMGGMWDQGVGSRCSGIWSLTPISFSGCSLAGHSWVLGGREFPKPTIWVSPSRVVALGRNVTIRCEGLYRSMEFFLHKAGHPNLQVRTVPDGTVAEFPIPSVGREDGGSYTCDYRSIVDQNRSSYLSDPVEIIVAGEGGARLRGPALSPPPSQTHKPSYPKPSISLSPSGGVSLGGVVSVWCRGQRRGMRFVLNKERRHFPPVDSDEFEVVFPISNVRWEDGGSYSCSYHSGSEPFTVSYPSDPVELVMRGARLDVPAPSPTPSLTLTGAPCGPVSSAAPVLTCSIIAGVSAAAVGLLLLLAFICYRRTRGIPSHSGLRRVELGIGVLVAAVRGPHCPVMASALTILLLELSFPKPSISLRPSRWVTLGGAVTIRCRGRHQNMRFLLYKDGNPNVL